MFKKFREFLIDKKDVANMMLVLSRNGVRYRCGNCGWKYAPDCYFFHMNLNSKKYVALLMELAKTDIELLPPTTGYEKA